MTEVWFRNPQLVMSVCKEEAVTRLSFTRKYLHFMKIDPIMWTRQFYMESALRPKIMVIGIQGAAEYHITDTFQKPRAVYPVWAGSDPIENLIDLIQAPWGEDEYLCKDESITSSLRPVFGQKHRVFLHNLPSTNSGIGKELVRKLNEIQQMFPNVELFLNGVSNFAALFGLPWKSCDFGLGDPGDANNKIILPNGVGFLRNDMAQLVQWEDWLKTMGFTIEQIIAGGIIGSQARTRLRIRSARWAAAHWGGNYRFFRDHRNIAVDTSSSNSEFEPPQSPSRTMRKHTYTLRDADKFLCNRCNIAPGCKAFRIDSICGLRESKVGDLEKFFQSRNAGKIVDGLAEIVRLQARRVENALDAESQTTEVDPEVTKALNALFANGVKLAKLVDPELAGGPKVQVNVGVQGNANVVAAANPKELVSGIVHALEQQGIPREKITPEMIAGVASGMATNGGEPQQAIEAAKISQEEKDFKNKLNTAPPATEQVLVGEILHGRDAE